VGADDEVLGLGGGGVILRPTLRIGLARGTWQRERTRRPPGTLLGSRRAAGGGGQVTIVCAARRARAARDPAMLVRASARIAGRPTSSPSALRPGGWASGRGQSRPAPG